MRLTGGKNPLFRVLFFSLVRPVWSRIVVTGFWVFSDGESAPSGLNATSLSDLAWRVGEDFLTGLRVPDLHGHVAGSRDQSTVRADVDLIDMGAGRRVVGRPVRTRSTEGPAGL